MTATTLRSALSGLCILGWHAVPVMAEPALPSLQSPELAQGTYATMHMLLQKTFLRIDVAVIEVRVDKPTQARLMGLAAGKPYSATLADSLARATMAAERGIVQMTFKRSVSLGRWMGVVRDNLEQARKAGTITPALEQKVSRALPDWFSALRDRGYEKNDRLIYGLAPDGLRTVVVSSSGQVLLDRMDHEPDVRMVVLASYFAPGSEFREPLLRSLFDNPR